MLVLYNNYFFNFFLGQRAVYGKFLFRTLLCNVAAMTISLEVRTVQCSCDLRPDTGGFVAI